MKLHGRRCRAPPPMCMQPHIETFPGHHLAHHHCPVARSLLPVLHNCNTFFPLMYRAPEMCDLYSRQVVNEKAGNHPVALLCSHFSTPHSRRRWTCGRWAAWRISSPSTAMRFPTAVRLRPSLANTRYRLCTTVRSRYCSLCIFLPSLFSILLLV